MDERFFLNFFIITAFFICSVHDSSLFSNNLKLSLNASCHMQIMLLYCSDGSLLCRLEFIVSGQINISNAFKVYAPQLLAHHLLVLTV